jgi:hypothetical protein
MPAPLRDAKLTDFFQRPKGSGNKAKYMHDKSAFVLRKQSSLPCVSSELSVSDSSSPLSSSVSNPLAKRQTGKHRRGVTDAKEVYPARLSLKAGPRSSRRILSPSPLNSASHLRSRVWLSSSQESSSSRPLTPFKRKPDDDDDTVSITSSGVPLSLSYTERQLSSPPPSKPPTLPLSSLSSSQPSTKRPRYASPPSLILSGPVTPKRTRGNGEIIPTSQSSEVGVYTPVRPNDVLRQRNDVQESVENWRHGRSAYRLETMSPLRYSPGDYSMEVDRPLSPLTSCPHSTTPGSPLSSLAELDATHSEVDPDDLPLNLPSHALPSPSSSSGKALPSPTQLAILSSVRPVTPPPSSPEQEQPAPAPVPPKDPKMRTKEIIAEIWANVRAKSVSDSEDSYLHAPVMDELSSEEEDDEPFWKRDKTSAR